MSTIVTLQLNATSVAGDWATRHAGSARTGTGKLGAPTHSRPAGSGDEIVVMLSEFHGVIESIKRGAHSPNISDSRTETVEVSYGTPVMYHGMRFAVGY